MPRRGRLKLQDQKVFFVTTTIKDHKRLLSTDALKLKFREILIESIRRHNIDLYGYVIMSNHFHLLLKVKDGGPGLAKFMQQVKSISARLLFPEHKGIWQERFDDVAIYTLEQFRIKLNYIHINPVKAGLVGEAERYEYFSARDWKGETSRSIVKTEIF